MADAWQILRDGGLPLAIPASGVARSEAELAEALQDAIATAPSGRDAEALAAFVFAWFHHWPVAFARALGSAAAGAVDWAGRHAIDDGRYLKLRRIAIENLARVL